MHLMKLQRVFITIICLIVIAIPVQSTSAQSPCGASYTVLPGDTLGEIALLCEINVTDLLKANPQISDPNHLTIGMTLSISSPQEQPSPKVVISPICGPPGTVLIANLQDFPSNLTVEIGVSRIDQTPGEFEKTRTDSLGRGKTSVTIPDTANEKEAWAVNAQVYSSNGYIEESSNFFYVTGPLDTGAATTYIVQPGDTLRSIAVRFNKSIAALIAENPDLTNPSRIYVGQRLNIPGISPGQPAVSISPACGPAGTVVQVVVSDFPVNSQIDVGVGKQGSAVNIVNTLSSNSDGGLETLIILPHDALPNQNWVVSAQTLESPVIKANSNLFSVIKTIGLGVPTIYIVQPGDTLGGIANRFGTSVDTLLQSNPTLSNPNSLSPGEILVIPGILPEVTITPERGLSGTTIQVEVTGYPSNTMLDIFLGTSSSTALLLGTYRTNSKGTLRTQGIIPETAKFNEQWEVFVRTSKGIQIDAVSNKFTVVRLNLTEQPVITIWPQDGPAGTKIDVVAMGFTRFARVEINLGRNVSDLELVDTVLTDINGTFYAQVNIPSTAQPNEKWIVLANTLTGPNIEAASIPFSVSP